MVGLASAPACDDLERLPGFRGVHSPFACLSSPGLPGCPTGDGVITCSSGQFLVASHRTLGSPFPCFSRGEAARWPHQHPCPDAAVNCPTPAPVMQARGPTRAEAFIQEWGVERAERVFKKYQEVKRQPTGWENTFTSHI